MEKAKIAMEEKFVEAKNVMAMLKKIDRVAQVLTGAEESFNQVIIRGV